jgi:carbon-monoxide dehydrogenase medium subunit
MKPVAFHYERPASLREAGALLGEAGVSAKAIAGSQSLGPMLNLRLAQPDLLVDVTGIPEMTSVHDTGDTIEIGACVTHADIEDGRVADPSNGLLPSVAGGIAYRAVRNRGTIGGSLAHADPAADWISVLPLLGAELIIDGPEGTRTLAAGDLMISSFTTTLAPDELIRAVRVPKLSATARWGFCKFNQKAGEFAHAIGAVLRDPDRGIFRAVIGAIEAPPIDVADATAIFDGRPDGGFASQVDNGAVAALLDASNVTDSYIRKLAGVALKRAALQAGAS